MRPPEHDPDEPPSKSARKREALDLQSLGEALIELPPAELAALGLPEALQEAIVAARGITSRGAGSRQRQFIGKLMRKVDPEPIRAAHMLAGSRTAAPRPGATARLPGHPR